MNNPFMSKEQKALKAKMALRRGLRDLAKWDKNLEKKKNDMIHLGQEAKRQGIRDQYLVAFNGLKMIMNQQLRARKMQLQLQLVETMRDLAFISSGFVGLMGNIGKEVDKVAGKADFLKNQMAFEKGMFAMENMMDEMDGFLTDNDGSVVPSSLTQSIEDEDIERLFDVTASAEKETDPELTALKKKIDNALKG